jgi:four helix bundle protein
MTAQTFARERLNIYRLSIDYVARSFEAGQPLEGLHRHAREKWFRAAQSIPLNIAEANGKRSLKVRARFLDIASGSALECTAIQDVLVRTKGIKVQDDADSHGNEIRQCCRCEQSEPAACHDILDKSARVLATFLFLEARAVALRLWKLTNAVVSSPDSSGFGLQVQSFSETHAEL